KMLHPFMPFITEELSSYLPGAGESITTGAYPEAGRPYPEEAAIMENLMDVVRAVRNLRTEMNVAQEIKTDCVCFSGDKVLRDSLVKGTEYIKLLAKVKNLVVKESGERPADSVTAIAGGHDGRATVEIFIPLAELVDVDSETKRLTKELEKLSAEYEGVEKRLSNEAFVGKAPKEVVEKEKARLSLLLEKKTKIEEGLSRLRSMKR
ncbi:MAG: class I tRNA ligase family protein, partial [Deltaproteobacteria bacterium]|nr:class I tRNA ligase family protein [Deltaproteobacteria bacterium]